MKYYLPAALVVGFLFILYSIDRNVSAIMTANWKSARILALNQLGERLKRDAERHAHFAPSMEDLVDRAVLARSEVEFQARNVMISRHYCPGATLKTPELTVMIELHDKGRTCFLVTADGRVIGCSIESLPSVLAEDNAKRKALGLDPISWTYPFSNLEDSASK